MSDTLGRITVPDPVDSGLTFPLVSDYGFGTSRSAPIIEHRFGSGATLSVQRFSSTIGPRKFTVVKSALSITERADLLDFYNAVQGSYQSFTYNAPSPDRSGSTTPYTVVFETQPLSITDLASMCRTGLVLVEIPNPASAPTYTINSTAARFPAAGLASDLLDQVQSIIPLIHIRFLDAYDAGTNPTGVPDVYIADRRCTVGSQLYLPRILDLGEPGTDVLMSQDINGSADSVTFTLGNADRAMSALAQDTNLQWASVDVTLARIRSNGTSVDLLQLWKGFVTSWRLDGSPRMSIVCSDGLYPITRRYPCRVVSRQCWKTFNDGVHCPYTAHGSGGDPDVCDYFFSSSNGCLAHGMSIYFGGHCAIPQSVSIKDNGTGWLSLGRKTVTSTSIISDSAWGMALPEIWCNDNGDPKQAFWANAIPIAVRDESDFQDLLGIVGAGPLGSYEGMSVQKSADGYQFLVCPLADNNPPHGFQVDSNFRVTGYHPDMGLREVLGTDPANSITDAFSLGQGTPQDWHIPDPTYGSIMPYSAGTAIVEVRSSKAANQGISPTTAESHTLSVPISRGLKGYKWNASDTRTAVYGMVNPFWVAVNTYLRLLGLEEASSSDQLAQFVRSSLYTGSTSGCAEIADILVTPLVGTGEVSYDITATGQAVNGVINSNDSTFSYWASPPDYANWSWDETQNPTMTVISLADALTAGYITPTSTSGTEIQFQFQGSLSDRKPFRDWLVEILAGALGFFTFEFGKLRLGIRANASSAASFSIANMLYQSLSMSPAEATFEELTVSFANAALQFQQDMAKYSDKDHAQYFGRSVTPLSSKQRYVGVSSMSQALRSAAIRTREEIGGILRTDCSNPYIEWDNNWIVNFRTTILALDTYVGQVISVTHPDIPTYPGPVGGSPSPDHTWKYRIQRWTLHKDWSVSISAKSVTDSMYDLAVGPIPSDVALSVPPVLYYSQSLGQWAPYQVQASASDALYPSEWTFALRQDFSRQADGSLMTKCVTSAKLPVNQFISFCGAPDLKRGSIAFAATGGSLVAGTTYRVQVCATSAGQLSPPSDVVIVKIPGTGSTNKFTLTNIRWPSFDGLDGYVLYASDQDDLVCMQQSGSLTGSKSAGYTPTSIAVTSLPYRSTVGVPNSSIAKTRVWGKRLIHGGVLGTVVTDISSTYITSTDVIDVTETDDWTGRVLAIIGRPAVSGAAPYVSFTISAFAPTTGTFTLDRNPMSEGVQIGDVFVVCTLGYDNSADPYVVEDLGLINVTSPSGETPDDPTRIGQSVLVIAGTSRGTSSKIVSNTATAYTLDTPIYLDTDSVWVVVESYWQFGAELDLLNADSTKTSDMTLEITNMENLSMLIRLATVDTNGSEASETNSPVRMIYIYGQQGTRTIYADDTMRTNDGLVLCDTTAGDIIFTCLPGATVPNQQLIVQKYSADVHTVTVKAATDELFDRGVDEIVLVDNIYNNKAVIKFFGS